MFVRSSRIIPGYPVIQLNNVSKRFKMQRGLNRSWQEVFTNLIQAKKNATAFFWPLRNLSLTVNAGECLGIIGANGAGKSTLLKLIAGVLAPTTGTVSVSGRVSALLELGAGFHPELSGRENVFLNGSILGLSRAEIKKNMDAIIDFAEISSFIDMPVKHYSSGMYVRLGFAVAVHAKPDVLLVDEVLAVGDHSFQAKCMGRIADLRRSGVTIVWASHDLSQVQKLCTRAVWIDDGRIIMDDVPTASIAAYLQATQQSDAEQLTEENQRVKQRLHNVNVPTSNGKGQATTCNASGDRGQQNEGRRYGNGQIRIVEVTMLDANNNAGWVFQANAQVRVRIRYVTQSRFDDPVFSILVHRDDGLYVTSSNTFQAGGLGPISGNGCVEVEFPSIELARGSYLLSVGAYCKPDPPLWGDPADFYDRMFRFRIESDHQFHGVVASRTSWRILTDRNY